MRNDAIYLFDVLGLKPCEKEWDIDITSFTLTTTLATDRSVEIQDPKGYIKGYLHNYVKDKATEAATKRSKFLELLQDARSTARSYLRAVGFLSEWMPSHGFVIDEIKMEVDFKCCKCDDNGVLKWVDDDASYQRTGLLLMLRHSAGDLAKAPSEYIDVMIGAARAVKRKCQPPNSE